jgi:glucan 1,3-beta-glucosidase
MRFPLALFTVAAVVIAATWRFMGAPVAMPPSPVVAGQKLYCVSYAPFRGAQSPLIRGTQIAAAQIDDDLARLARFTDCVRTYSVEDGLDQVAALAGKHGLKVIQGLWLSSDRTKNEREIAAVIALANRYPDVIRSVVVGNEVLLRGELSGDDVAAIVRRVKAAVPEPVTYAEVWEFWLRHPEVYQAVDFVTIHILPYWEDFPIAAADAAAHVDAIRAKVAAAFPGKPVLIGEVGWPSAGRMREGALPSPSNQAKVLAEVLAAAQRGHYDVNLIEAFDQPWKRRLEGTVGGHWGLYDAVARQPKFAWGAPVSDHPAWPWQAAGGVAFAALIFGIGALVARRRRGGLAPAARQWLAVGAIATVGGLLIGWSVEKLWVESFGLGGWIRSAALFLVAAGAPPLAAAALIGRVRVPSLAEVLGGEDSTFRAGVPWLLGIVLAASMVLAVQTALGLTFDPRYRDFPFPSLGMAASSYFMLALRRRPRAARRETAETIAATVLGLCAVYIAFNESFANWQSLALVAALAGLAFSLWRFAGVQNPG